MAQHNLYFLAKGILGFDGAVHPEGRGLSRTFHGPLCRELDQVQLPYARRLDLWPRGHLKTHLGTIAKGIQYYLQDHNVRILLVGASEDGPIKNLRAIKQHFQSNPLLHWLFPECLPDTRQLWAQDEIVLPRTSNRFEPTFKTIGIGGHITGHHFNVILGDDVIDEKHRSSQLLMEEAKDWHVLSKNLFDSLMSGVHHLVATPWSINDLYAWIMAHEPEYVVRRVSQLLPDGTLVWPEADTVEAVLRYRTLKPTEFACQRQCNPRDAALVAFDPAWLRYYHLANQAGDLVITAEAHA